MPEIVLIKPIKSEMCEVKVEDLKPHPINEEIYGDDDVTSLVEEIKKRNFITPLIITYDNVIISGHRRAKACKVLGITEVQVEKREYADDGEYIETLINENNRSADRVITREIVARQLKVLMKVQKRRAEIRMLSGVRIDPSAEKFKGTKGKSSQKVLEDVKNISLPEDKKPKSYMEVERLLKTVNTIDDLLLRNDDSNKDLKIEMIRGQLEKGSVTTAAKLAKYIDPIFETFVDNEDKETIQDYLDEIKTGKKSANSIVTEYEKTLKPAQEPKEEIIIDSEEPKRIYTAKEVVQDYNERSLNKKQIEYTPQQYKEVHSSMQKAFDKFKLDTSKISLQRFSVAQMTAEEWRLFNSLLSEMQRHMNNTADLFRKCSPVENNEEDK